MKSQTTQSLDFSTSFLKPLLLAAHMTCCAIFSAHAQGIFAEDACDPKYYESLESRAWLEAQREITQNQNLIVKGDSVLEYSCFDKHMGVLASNAWSNAGANMGSALSSLAGSAMDEYLDSNFNHAMLGGRSNINYEFNGNVSGGSYNCDMMKRVWEAAKCMHFIDTGNYDGKLASDYDGFFTFAEYANMDDRRFLPSACSNNIKDEFKNHIEKSVVDDETSWEEDPLVTFYDLIFPEDSTPSHGNECEPVVDGGEKTAKTATGLIVKSTERKDYPEFICVVPGCYYEPPDDGSGNGECKGR